MKESSTEYYQITSQPWGEMKKSDPNVKENTHGRQKCEGKQLSKLPLREEMEDVGEQPIGHAFMGVNLPQKSNSHFPKTDGFSNSNLDYHTLPIPMQ